MELLEDLISCKEKIAEIQEINQNYFQTLKDLRDEKKCLKSSIELYELENTDDLEFLTRLIDQKNILRGQTEESACFKPYHSISEEPETPESSSTDRSSKTHSKSESDKKKGETWRRNIGNALQITPVLYKKLLKTLSDKANFYDIMLDYDFEAFQKKIVTNIVEAFAAYRPDIGYHKGIGHIASVLLNYLSPYKSFESIAI